MCATFGVWTSKTKLCSYVSECQGGDILAAKWVGWFSFHSNGHFYVHNVVGYSQANIVFREKRQNLILKTQIYALLPKTYNAVVHANSFQTDCKH